MVFRGGADRGPPVEEDTGDPRLRIDVDRTGPSRQTRAVTSAPVRALIFGASGYSGLELVRWLCGHPHVRLAGLSSDKWAGRDARAEVPALAASLSFVPHEQLLAAVQPGDVVFLATPAETSLALAPQLLARDARVVDLSGAFRLRDTSLYPAYYGFAHHAPELVARAHYGLPELFGPPPADTRLVSNPGCYATAAALAWAPLVRAGLVEGPVFLDGKSGTSGAGRRGEEAYSYSEIAPTVRTYKPTGHQHIPEIEQSIGATVTFVPHLIPVVRGLLVTGQARVPAARAGAGGSAVGAALEAAYAAHRFVRVVPKAPEFVRVVHGNFVELSWAYDTRTETAIVMSALDNLVKGAAGQAIQNLNLLLGLPETTGLCPS